MRSRESLATAASTAAINSGSGGSGMYSLAPAWMAATAARASLLVPQATIGTWMCSASRRCTRSRMSSATSAMIRSAPRPERKTASAWPIESAWVTVAPLSIASLVAVVSWPLRVPTIRRRMVRSYIFAVFGFPRMANRRKSTPPAAIRHSLFATYSIPLRLDDFRHRHAELLLDQHDLAAGHQTVVDIDVDGLAHLAVELEH